jgi:cyclopropane fatty-acyl-phospholipid synthase-like methyltransferase
MEGKRVLETGCGRGGGIKLMLDKFNPLNVVGADLSISNVILSFFYY